MDDIFSHSDNAAAISLLGSRELTPEKARKNLQTASETGLPPGLIRSRDNQEHPLPEVSRYSPPAKDLIAESPELAALTRKSPEKFNAVLDDDFADADPELNLMRIRERVSREGYSPTQLNELKLAGYVRKDGKWFKRVAGRESEIVSDSTFLMGLPMNNPAWAGPGDAKETLAPVEGNPVLPHWYQGEKGKYVNETIQNAVNRFRATGTAALTPAEKEAGVSRRDIGKALAQDKRILETLNSMYGAVWRDFDDNDLRRAVDKIGGALGISTEGYDLNRIKPMTFTGDYTSASVINLFGLVVPLADLLQGRPGAEELVRIANDPNATEEQLQWLNEDLLVKVRELRGQAGSTQFIEGLMNAGKFASELWLTGGKSLRLGALNANLRNFGVVKGAAKTVAAMGVNALKQLGFYAPGKVMEAFDKKKQANYNLDANGEVMAELTEKEANDVAIYLANGLVDQYIELFSEQTGIFFDKLGASKLVKSAIKKLPGNVLGNALESLASASFGSVKWKKVYQGVLSDIGLNGILGEYGEEKVGSFIRSGVSALARAFDSQLLNLTEDKTFGTLSDEMKTFAQVAAISGTFRAPLILTSPVRAFRAAEFVDNQAKWKEKFDAIEDVSASPEATQMVYNKLILPQSAHVDPTALRELSESEGGEAILEKLGISQEQLNEAELNGNMVTISLGQAMSALDAKEHASVIGIATPDSVRSVDTVENYLEQMTDEKVKRVYEERQDYQKAYNEALTQLATLGRPDSEIRSVAKILGSYADFFGERSGMTAAEWIRNVAFEKMKEADWEKQFKQEGALYQPSRSGKRGATTFDANADMSVFNDTWKATITLFENADASTLVHEIEHYAVRMMECLVSADLADSRMKADLETLKSWAKEGLTEEVYKETVGKLNPEKDKIPTFDEWLYSEAHEKIARAFEAYIREGKAPKAELTSAFSIMRRLLRQVYRSANLLGVKLSDDVREVFDGMLSADELIDAESDFAEALRNLDINRILQKTDAGLLSMSKDEVGDYRKILEKANEQAWQELQAEKDRQLKTLRTLWAKDAKTLMADEPVYNAWNDIRKSGGMGFEALSELVGKEAAAVLKLKGLTSRKGEHPASFAERHNYESVETMVLELLDAQSPKEFVDSYVSDAVARFHQDFQFTDAAASVEAVSEALDKLSTDLDKLSGRQNRAKRRAELRYKAGLEIGEMSVNDIMSNSKLVKECKRHSRLLTEAIAKQDYITSAEELAQLRSKLEVLRFKGQAEKVIRKLQDRFRKTISAKPGKTIDGSYQDAILDLAIRLGLSKRKSPGNKLSAVLNAFNEANPDQYTSAPAIALGGTANFGNLQYKDAESIYNLVEFLYHEGRDIVSGAKTQAREYRENTIAESVGFLASGKADKAPTAVNNLLISATTIGSKLRNIIGFASKWDENSVLFREILNPIKLSESQSLTLSNRPKRKVTDALKLLRESSGKWDLMSIQDIRFPSALTRTNGRYTKWDAPMVIMACLNMGNARNRQALLNGFQWSESDLNRVASLLSAADWKAVQQIWDAVGDPAITRRLQTVFRNIYHYDLPMEEALPFAVTGSSGEQFTVSGGYFPLMYAGRFRPEKGETDPLKKQEALPEYRRAGFTYTRHDNIGDPLDLSDIGSIVSHIYDVCHYVTHVETIRKVMPVVRDFRFKTEFIAKEGKPRYDKLVELLNNVADPSEALKGTAGAFERWARAVKTSLALWGSIKTVTKQFASVTVGMEEIGPSRYFSNAVRFAGSPAETWNFISKRSGFMADRMSNWDFEVMFRNDGSFRGKWGVFNENIRKAGYRPAGVADIAIAVPGWLSAYDLALEKGMSEPQAIAEADDFVARTQGGTRPMDVSPVQLNHLGRMFTMFYSASSAGATSVTRAFGKMYYGGKLNPAALFLTVLAPPVATALIEWAMSGDDGDDDFWVNFSREALLSAVSGHLIPEAVAQTAATTGGRGAFKSPVLEGAGQVASGAVDAFKSASKGDWQRVAYRVAEVAGALNLTPVLTNYNRIIKMMEDWNDGDIDADIKETFGHIKDKNK